MPKGAFVPFLRSSLLLVLLAAVTATLAAPALAAPRAVPFGPPTTLLDGDHWQPDSPFGLFVTPQDGALLVTAGQGRDVAVAVRPDGGRFRPAWLVNGVETGGDGVVGWPTVTRNGRALLVWEHRGKRGAVRIARTGPGGRVTKHALPAPADGRPGAWAQSANGRSDVVWAARTDGVAVVSVAPGGAITTQRIATRWAEDPAIVAGPAGQAVVAWRDVAPCPGWPSLDCDAIMAAVRPGERALFGPPQTLDVRAPDMPSHPLSSRIALGRPQVVADGDRVVVAWHHANTIEGFDGLRVAVGGYRGLGRAATVPDTAARIAPAPADLGVTEPYDQCGYDEERDPDVLESADEVVQVLRAPVGATDLLLRDGDPRCASAARRVRIAADGTPGAPVTLVPLGAEEQAWTAVGPGGRRLLVGPSTYQLAAADGAVQASGRLPGVTPLAAGWDGDRAVVLTAVRCSGGLRTDALVVEPSGAVRRTRVLPCAGTLPELTLDGTGRVVVVQRGKSGALVARASCPVGAWAAGGARARCRPPRA